MMQSQSIYTQQTPPEASEVAHDVVFLTKSHRFWYEPLCKPPFYHSSVQLLSLLLHIPHVVPTPQKASSDEPSPSQ